MAVQFNIPKQRKKSIDVIDNFLGADFTNSPAGMDKSKSPNLKNMIRDVPGKIRKCMGYETVWNLSEGNPTGNIFYDDYNDFSPRCIIECTNDTVSFVKGTEEYFQYALYFKPAYHNILHNYYEEYGTRFNAGLILKPNFYPNSIDWEHTKIECHPDRMEKNRRYAVWFQFLPVIETINNYKVSFIDDFGREINGYYRINNIDFVHVGSRLQVLGQSPVYTDMNHHRSMGWEFNNALYIVDGKKFLSYSPTKNVSDTAYRTNKSTNNVVVNENVVLSIVTFTGSQGVGIYSSSTTSPNGSFQIVDEGSGTYRFVYIDKLTSVNQNVTFSIDCWSDTGGEIGELYESGTHYLHGIAEYGNYEISPVEDKAYVPLITISKDPDGGGTSYNDLNLLSPAFTERFLPKKVNNTWLSDYQMSFDDLDEVEPIVKKLNDSTGVWETLTINVDYTVDYSDGIITFTTAPTRPDQSGEDRISITAYKTFPGYSDRINKCTIGTVFGVNGANDRLFLSGNPDYPNYDWYSGAYMLPEDEQDQESAQVNFTSPTYFPDTGYSTLGSTGSAIVGYSRVGNYLATHKDKYEKDQNIIIREGALEDSKPVFRVVNTLQGAPAIAPYSFEYLATEPIFLTEKGVYAITAYDITGEKYAQNRSFYLDGKLLKEANMEQAYSCVFNDMYWLCLNGVAYILDGLQPIRSDKSEPYATRQYVGFYRTNIPAYTMWESDGRLYFGTEDGKIMRFYNDKYDLESYNDDGEPIEAIWESGDLTGNVFFKNKTLNHIAVKLDSAIAASVTIEVMWRGLWNFVRTDHWRARQFQFSTEQFQYHTFSNDHTQRVLPKKVRFKNVDKFRLRLSNNELNESFALYDVGIEFTETDNYTR